MQENSNTIIYTTKNIQEILGCGRKQAYEVMHIKDFPSFQIGNKLYVEKMAFELWLKRIQHKKINI